MYSRTKSLSSTVFLSAQITSKPIISASPHLHSLMFPRPLFRKLSHFLFRKALKRMPHLRHTLWSQESHKADKEIRGRYICTELQMPTAYYPESGPQPAANITVPSLILQIDNSSKWNGCRSGGNTDPAVSLKAVTSVYNSTLYVQHLLWRLKK